MSRRSPSGGSFPFPRPPACPLRTPVPDSAAHRRPVGPVRVPRPPGDDRFTPPFRGTG
ncbi:hypothetical protein SSCG_06263 [Streptomyces clavuligerus]|nr:hypothetical protein SSCG_06263 [Streptomyces clavuligerus]